MGTAEVVLQVEMHPPGSCWTLQLSFGGELDGPAGVPGPPETGPPNMSELGSRGLCQKNSHPS